ncbi:hypothetical protein D3C80_676480 [compost metagenome]
MSRNRKCPSVQTVEEYRKEYRRLDNQVICILQLRWPANEVSQWVAMLQSQQQEVACAIRSLRCSTCRPSATRSRTRQTAQRGLYSPLTADMPVNATWWKTAPQ